MVRRGFTLCLIATLTALAQTGCGLYSFSGSSLPSHIKTIAVPIFDNATLEFDIANQVTQSVTQRFLDDNRLKIVGESRADCILNGRITSYENKVHNYSASETPEDYIVVLRAAVTLRDMKKNHELWKDDAMTVSAVYSVQPGAGQTLTDEQSARQKAIHDLAEDILARTMEQW